MANPRTYVEAPPVTPAPFGLFSAAIVLEDLDGTRGLGVQYEPASCAPVMDTVGACKPQPDYGYITVTVNDTRGVSINGHDGPSSPYSTFLVEWGDGETSVLGTNANSGSLHTYAADGTYVIQYHDDYLGYTAQATVEVVDGQAVDPVDVDAVFNKAMTSGVDLVDVDPFTLYQIFECAPVGWSQQEFMDRARTGMRLGEQRGIERVLAQRLPLQPGAVDLTPTPGTPVHPARGVALLEGFAGRYYAGVPTIHVPRETGSLLGTAGTIIRSATRLETVQGALVAAGGGYDQVLGPMTDPQDPNSVQYPGQGQAYIYVTGTVVVRRSPVIEVGPVMSVTPANNTQRALVERLAGVSWECITAAVLVDNSIVDA